MDAAIAADPPADPPPNPPAPALPFVPVAAAQRIEALDVVRGFALLGIFLMNIEWFSRPFTSFGDGMPRGLTGADWLASWFVAFFVQGKFWTIFSLLFGMGFAVMLVRAERAGRPFVGVYLRRILALAVFGAAHYIFLWVGDILFSYAVAALALLIVLYGRPWPILIAIAAVVGLGIALDVKPLFAIASGLATYGLIAIWLRRNKPFRLFRRSMPLFSFIVLLAGAAVSIAAIVFWVVPDLPTDPRAPLAVMGPLLLVFGALSWKYHEPESRRSVRLAIGLYVFSGLAMTLIPTVLHFMPDPAAPVAGAPAAAGAPARKASDAKMTPAERAAEARAEREKHIAEHAADQAEELRIFTTGSYRETVEWHARRFPAKAAGDFGFAVVLVCMFLLGTWFVRSGVMDDPQRHLPFFRKLAFVALPIGVGVGILSGLIAMSHVPGDRYDGWGIARGLVMLGNLPACLGYVGLVVVLMYSSGIGSRIRVLAPAGRMALTNYLTQSLICVVYFYGCALGHWGMPRAQQVLFVAAVYAAQVAFSHWWLLRFRYGPMEWLWRGFTYRQLPPLRVDRVAGGAPAGA